MNLTESCLSIYLRSLLTDVAIIITTIIAYNLFPAQTLWGHGLIYIGFLGLCYALFQGVHHLYCTYTSLPLKATTNSITLSYQPIYSLITIVLWSYLIIFWVFDTCLFFLAHPGQLF